MVRIKIHEDIDTDEYETFLLALSFMGIVPNSIFEVPNAEWILELAILLDKHSEYFMLITEQLESGETILVITHPDVELA